MLRMIRTINIIGGKDKNAAMCSKVVNEINVYTVSFVPLEEALISKVSSYINKLSMSKSSTNNPPANTNAVTTDFLLSNQVNHYSHQILYNQSFSKFLHMSL